MFHPKCITVVSSTAFQYAGIGARPVINTMKGIFGNENDFGAELKRYRRDTFTKELDGRDEIYVLSVNVQIKVLQLGSDLFVQALESRFCLIVYPELSATLHCRVQLSEIEWGLKQIAAVANLFRSVPTPQVHDRIHAIIEEEEFVFFNIDELFSKIISDFREAYDLDIVINEPVRFIYPYIHIARVVGCHAAQEILDKYRKEIAALIDFWPHYYGMISEDEIEARVYNWHPLTFGLTCIDMHCAVSLHPEHMGEAFAGKGWSFLEHHHAEIGYLLVMIDLVLSQLLVLRACDAALNERIRSDGTHFPYVDPVSALLSATRILILEKKVAEILSLTRYANITRKPFARKTLTHLMVSIGRGSIVEGIIWKLEGLHRASASLFRYASGASLLLVLFLLLLSAVCTMW